ncbi:MAG: ATP-binding protein [bacterium]
MLNNLHAFYSLIVKVNCPEGAWLRRGKALALLILGTLIAGVTVSSINLLEVLSHFSSRGLFFLLSDFFLLALFSFLFFLNRAGLVRLSAYTFLVLLVIVISGLFPVEALDKVTIAYAIPTIAASFLISPYGSFLFWVLSTAGYTLALAIWGWPLPYNYFFVLSLFLIALVSWLASSQLENALSKVQRSLNGERKKTSTLQEEVQDEQTKQRQLERLNRALRTISECNQVLVRTLDEKELVGKICRVLVETGGYRLVWVSYAENKNRSMRLMARAGENGGSMEALNACLSENDLVWEAMSMGKPVVFSDLPAEAVSAPWAEKLRDCGCSSAIFFPLKLNERHAGIIAIGSSEPRAFDEEESALLLGLAEDVSFGITALRNRQARKRAEKVLRESEERFRTLAQNAQDILFRFRLSPSWAFEYINPVVSGILGYTPEEHYLDPELWFKIVLPEDHQVLESLFKLEAPFNQTIALRFKKKDGKTVWTEQRSISLKNEKGEIIGIEGIIRDITARKTVEEELQRSKMELLYAVSHELKTPLVNLMSAYDFIKSLPEELKLTRFLEYESVWERNLKRLHSLINNLIDSQRISTTEINLKLEPLDLAQSVKKVIKTLEGLSTSLEITLELEYQSYAQPILVIGHEEVLNRIVENLLSNALKFSPRRSRVAVRLWRENGYGCFSVLDQGPGISLEEQKNLFQPFWRASRETQGTVPGVGLGLYVSKIAVEALKGQIELESYEGKGTRVTVKIPLYLLGTSNLVLPSDFEITSF